MAGGSRVEPRKGESDHFVPTYLCAIRSSWRPSPRVERGVAVERVGLETLLRFELESSSASTR
jgi:hypothetical protein